MTDEKDDSILSAEEPLIMITPEGAREVSLEEVDAMFIDEMEEKFLPEGTEVSVTAHIDYSEDSEELTLTGQVVGLSILPGGMEEIPAYIVKLDNPELVPDEEDGTKYGYSCITFPTFMVTPIRKVEA